MSNEHLRDCSETETDRVRIDLQERVQTLREAIVRVLTPGAHDWRCSYCDGPLPLPGAGEWMDGREVLTQAERITGYCGAVANIARWNLVHEGVLEMDNSFRLRLADAGQQQRGSDA